jgi:3-keto-5-aminohexanoate cleavage enzyme
MRPFDSREQRMTDKEWEGAEWAEMVLRQERNITMDKKLIITVCPVGALFSRRHNPYMPYSPEEIAQEVIESYQEGAAVAHLHTRDQNGRPGSAREDLRKTIDIILRGCPDIIIQPSSCEGYIPGKTTYSYETVKPMAEELQSFNHNYMESTIFTPVSYACEDVDGFIDISLATRENAVKTVQYFQENHIKPEFMNHNWEGIQNVTEWLIKPGILEKPYLMSMGPGMHNAAATYPDPWGFMYLLGMMKMMPEDSVLSVSAGGRNWLPLTCFAITMGVDGVRVGMEDHLWMYPHRDDLIEKNADATKKIARIARELGREVAAPREARVIMGIH